MLVMLFAGISVIWIAWHNVQTDIKNGTSPEDIKAAVKKADAAEAKSVRSLDPQPLYAIYSGSALTQELSHLSSLKQSGTTAEETLISQRFSNLLFSPDKTQADIEVTEIWDITTYAEPAHTVVKHEPFSTNRQTVMLKHTPNGWSVDSILFYSQ